MLALLRDPEPSATDALPFLLSPTLRLVRNRSNPDWHLYTHVLHCLLDARGPVDLVHRAAASLGLLPQVAWTDVEGSPATARTSISIGLARPQAETQANRSEPARQWLEVGLEDPDDPDARAMLESLLSLIAKAHARELERERLATEAYRDALTGLWNRRAFNTFLDQALARRVRMATPMALIVCDLDNFKQINDARGHAAGDIALRHVASCMEKVIRPSDIAARLGGDELVILLNDTDAEGAMHVTRRLQLAIAADNPLAPAALTLSMGIADQFAFDADLGPEVVPAANAHPLEAQRRALFDAADRALYRAKSEGRDRACVDALSEARVVAPATERVAANDDDAYAD